jgi:Zn-dependent M28 family amino/carboxypeptidase
VIAARMPGRSFSGSPPPLTAEQLQVRDDLRRHVEELAGRIGERNDVRADNLEAAARYIEQTFARSGLRSERQTFKVGTTACSNIEVETRGRRQPDEIVIIGAHYDSVYGSPGADDNGSGAAALLVLAQQFAKSEPAKTLRFVAFVNEEPPHFQSEQMGSLVYARRSAQRKERIVAMMSLETIGYFDSTEGSQQYPSLLGPFFPSRGNFIAFTGNLPSSDLLRRVIRAFRKSATVASEAAALPELVGEVGWSDQWAFWRFGFPGIMVTDTAPFRNPNYHTANDVPSTVDYDALTRVVDGLKDVVRDLAGTK